MTHSTSILTVHHDTRDAPAPGRQNPSEPSTREGDGLTDEAHDWSWVIAAPFRAHVQRVLTAEPVPWRAFAGYARVPDTVIRGLLGLGRPRLRRIPPHYAYALLNIDSGNLRADLVRPVDPDAARTAAQALLGAGWSISRISRAGSIAEPRLRALLRGEDLAITQRTALLITAAARAHGHEPEDLDGLDAAAEPIAA